MSVVGLKLTEIVNFETRRILCRNSGCEPACNIFMDLLTITVNNFISDSHLYNEVG
jgi:hypothetical protein